MRVKDNGHETSRGECNFGGRIEEYLMVRKKNEQSLSDWQESTGEDIVAKIASPMPIPAGLNASDGDEWFHFQGH
jgi:hypothetical protein